MKKAQMEIMGLAVIVILLVIAMLFVIGIMLNPEKSIRKPYTYEKLASNSMNAVLKTSTSCRNLDIKDLLKDCGGDQVIFCGDQPSCIFLTSEISKIFEDTITPLNIKYFFNASVDTGLIIEDLEF